jgi:hypothetical protein
MAFKGLEDRFLDKASKLYGFGTTDNGGVNKNTQPFVKVSPLDPNRSETTDDTFGNPVGSIKRDTERLGKFLVSDKGLLFLASQKLLQTGNEFSQTRTIDKNFIIANIEPFVYSQRSEKGTVDYDVRNADGGVSPASNDANVGGAGRMQRSTAKDAIGRVSGQGGVAGLLTLLPPNKILDKILGTVKTKDGGSTGMDERPELDIFGSYYSIAMWKKYEKRSPQDYFKTAKKSLKSGNILGAFDNLRNAGKQVESIIRGIPSGILTGSPLATPSGRGFPDTKGIEGSRYFITDRNNADRYLRNSITADGEADVGFLDRQPYRLSGKIFDMYGDVSDIRSPLPSLGGKLSGVQKTLDRLNDARRKLDAAAKKARTVISAAQSVYQRPTIGGAITAFQDISRVFKGGSDFIGKNPAADSAMLFGRTSLQSRYNDGEADAIRLELQTQKNTQFSYWKKIDPYAISAFTKGGVKSGYRPGTDINVDPSVRVGSANYGGDRMNLLVSMPTQGKTEISQGDEKDLQKLVGKDLVNVRFFDYSNKRAIPFRAFVSGLNETVSPEYSDRRYIGRTERNIIYVGAQRDVNFQLRVQAFSKDELENVWGKVNAMTALCFPAQYEDGFMVPPFVRLTIGDVYKNQAGFIKTLSHNMGEEEWEIQEGSQAPFGITMSIGFSIIENVSRTGQSISKGVGRFYNIATPITR